MHVVLHIVQDTPFIFHDKLFCNNHIDSVSSILINLQQWLSRGWDIVDSRYVLRRLRAEYILSLVAVVTGRVKNIRSSLRTSDIISFPMPTLFMTTQIVRTFVTSVFGYLEFLV